MNTSHPVKAPIESAPWIPPVQYVFQRGERFSLDEARLCLLDCFRFHVGEDRFHAELARCKLRSLKEAAGTDLTRERLMEGFETLRERALALCDRGAVMRSFNRLKFILTHCSDEASVSEEHEIREENDIAVARDSAMRLAQTAGFSTADSTSVATVVSELARNILRYAGTGTMKLSRVAKDKLNGIKLEAIDSGPGIENIDSILAGKYKSRTGMGLGLIGSKRLLDHFTVDTGPGRGTRIVGIKYER